MQTYYIYPAGAGAPGAPDNSLPGGGGAVDPGYGVSGDRPSHPIVLPPLPGVWPPAGQPSQPIYIPPHVENPIVITGSPEHPIALPPNTIWPPLPPTTSGKYAILIWVVGVGSRWLVVEPPPVAQPK
jgi:hypothetical protein